MAYITKKTASQIVLESQQGWAFLFILIFSGATFLMAIAMIIELGITTLSCQRIEPDRVNCQKSKSKYFGLVKQEPEPLGQVTQAEFKSEVQEGGDEDTVYNWVSLSTQSGDITLFDDPIFSFNSNSGYPEEMQSLATQINQFIQSNEPSLILQRDTRLNSEILLVLLFLIVMSLPLFFLLLFLIAIVFSPIVSLGLVSKDIFVFDKATQKLTHQRKNFLVRVEKEHSFDRIVRLEKEISNVVDKDDNYKFFLEYIEPYPFIKTSTLELELDTAIAEELSAFVALPIQTAAKSKASESPEQIKTVDKTVVFEGQKSTYYTTGLEAIPAPESDIQEIHQKLLRLGFEFLGDLLCSKCEYMTSYYYILPKGDIFADISKTREGLVICNLITDFVSGTSISTNTLSNTIYKAFSKGQDSKKYKATHFNYPGLDISELYNRHRQHIVEVGAREGRVKRVELSLLAIAQLTDEVFVKQDEQ